MPTVLITGGRGLIGRALSQLLVGKGYQVTVLSRDPGSATAMPSDPSIKYARWNLENQTIDKSAIQGADYIIHLAGAGVADKRWSPARKKEITESRVKSSGLLVKALQEIPNQVEAVISASAIGWYGPDKESANQLAFRESDPADTAFLGETCRLWEESIDPVEGLNKRLVKLRTGIVLASDGGAFSEFKKPVKFGIAAILGNGRQVVSWIHLEDLCRIYLEAMEHKDWNGVYNAVAPNPVTNKKLTLELARALKGNFFIPLHIPSLMLKFVLGEMSIEVLKSATVSDQKIRDKGFQFLYPSIEAALQALLRLK